MLNSGSIPFPVSEGGTGLATTTAYGVMCAGTTSTAALQCLSSVGTAGQVLTSGGASALPSFASIGTAVTWAAVSGTTQSAAVNSGYIIQNASATTVTLPTIAAIGAIVQVQGLGAGGWILAANTGQTIHLGTATTSSAGNLTSSNQYDSVQVVCVVANTTWSVCFALTSGLAVN